VVMTADADLARLEAEVTAYPNVVELTNRQRRSTWDETPLLVPCELTMGGVDVSLFSTLTTFGTPRDITLEELVVELFFPGDDATEVFLRGGALEDGVPARA
jgi:hypothetical protein